MKLVQISKVKVDVERQARSSDPVFELRLDDRQHVIGVAHYWTTDRESRETVDHHGVFWIASDLGGRSDA